MANYSDIKGFTVQTLSSDPAASIAATGSWASGGTMNTGRSDLAGLGIQTSAMAVAGYSGSTSSAVENYDGTSWTEIAELNSARNSLGGFGATNTASIACGGRSPTTNKTEYWNGSSWTEVNEMNTARFAMNISGAGTATSGLISGGDSGQDTVEVWDGTNWTAAGAELNTARSQGSASGQSSSSAVAVGGAPGQKANTEQWNGSSWTEVADLNSARYSAGASGDVNSILLNGGELGPAQTTKTESFDGTSWVEVADLSTARKDHGSTGYSSSNTSGLSFAGKAPPTSFKSSSELWTTTPSALFQKSIEGQLFFNSTANAFKETVTDIPGATWASSGALNSPRGNAGTSGTQTAALFYGGDGPPGTIAITELYNGSSWTEVGDLNIARSQTFFSNQGTSTAALNATGSPIATNVESWNGSSWTETTDLNTARRNGASLGTQGAMLGTGGYYGTTYATLTEIWNGSSWTETGDCPDAKFIGQGGGGTTTAGIIAGNYPNGDVDSSQTWDGTTWTNGPNINTGRSGIAFSAASQSSALAHGGGVGTPQAASKLTEFFDGTSWTELNDMSQVSQSGGGAGNSILGIHYGGYGPGALTTTEEWTAGLSNKTITTS
jgi:hypothetical protein